MIQKISLPKIIYIGQHCSFKQAEGDSLEFCASGQDKIRNMYAGLINKKFALKVKKGDTIFFYAVSKDQWNCSYIPKKKDTLYFV